MTIDHCSGKAPFKTAEEAVSWIIQRQKFGMRCGLEGIISLTMELNNPQKNLKFIHVAGTNGKGSVCAFLTSMLLHSGFNVGTFTSPYLISYMNRLQFNGQDIPEETLLFLVNQLKPIVEHLDKQQAGPCTMFEITTALALLYYGTVVKPDFIIWETGLGGRLDATNIVKPIMTIITNIGHDHMEVLGSTLQEVAKEKAGILKSGVPLVTAVSQEQVFEVIKQIAGDKLVEIYRLGDDFTYTKRKATLDEQQFSFKSPFRMLSSLMITLNGEHQLQNAAVALMAIELLNKSEDLKIKEPELTQSLRATFWPGRLEMIRKNPRILLDGAHNPEGMRSLVLAIRHFYPYQRLNVMLAMMPDKRHEETLRHILPYVNNLVLTELETSKKKSAHELAFLVKKIGNPCGEVYVESNWQFALDRLLEPPQSENVLNVIAGSLYLVASVRARLRLDFKS